jgi:hypothetical protein
VQRKVGSCGMPRIRISTPSRATQDSIRHDRFYSTAAWPVTCLRRRSPREPISELRSSLISKKQRFILVEQGMYWCKDTILAAIGKIAANHARNSRTTESAATSSCAPVTERKSQPGRNSTTDVDHDMLVIHTREGHRRNSFYPCSGIITNSRDSFLSRNGSKNSDVFARIFAPEGQHIVNMPKEQFWSRISFVRCEKCC